MVGIPFEHFFSDANVDPGPPVGNVIILFCFYLVHNRGIIDISCDHL